MNKIRAKMVNEKEYENIKAYEDRKILHKLSKPRSPQTIIFLEDDQDPWLIDVKYYQTKSGNITHSHTIIRADLDHTIDHLIRLGYKNKK